MLCSPVAFFFDFGPLGGPVAALMGPLAPASFLASLVVGRLYESSKVCLVLPDGAIELLQLHANMQSAAW